MKTLFIPLKQSPEDEGGGGGGGNNTPNPTPNPTPTDADKEKERLYNENLELRKKAKENEAKAQQALDEIAALKKSGHKTAGDWQKLAETLEKENQELQGKFKKTNEAFVNTLTSSRLREEALKQGAKADMVDLIDSMEFSEIEADIDENNRFVVKGVETAVSNLKKLRPSFFDLKQAPQFNKGGVSTPGQPKGLAEAKEAFLAAMKNRAKNPAAYNQAHLDYQKAIKEAKTASK